MSPILGFDIFALLPAGAAPEPSAALRQECTVEIKDAGWADVRNARSKFELPEIGPSANSWLASSLPS